MSEWEKRKMMFNKGKINPEDSWRGRQVLNITQLITVNICIILFAIRKHNISIDIAMYMHYYVY
jgi:hypothetical protein